MTIMYRRPGALSALVAAAAIGLALIGLAGCSGGSSSAPSVASLPPSSGGPTATGAAAGSTATASSSAAASGGGSSTASATQLLDQWAACMRSQGDAGQTDPTIDSDGVIHIAMPVPAHGNTDQYGQEAHNSSGPCGHYLQQASKLLLGGQPSPPPPSLATELKYAECMRANGVPKYPDPNGSNEGPYIGNLDPSGPVFQNANKLCSAKYGLPTGNEPEPPGSIMVAPANPPHGNRSGSGPIPVNSGAGGNG